MAQLCKFKSTLEEVDKVARSMMGCGPGTDGDTLTLQALAYIVATVAVERGEPPTALVLRYLYPLAGL